MQNERWVRVPGPGEFRGEGTWTKVTPAVISDEDYAYCERTGYFPVAERFDHTAVNEVARPTVTPNYLIQDGWLIHQVHQVRVPLRDSTEEGIQRAQRTLLQFIKSTLEVAG